MILALDTSMPTCRLWVGEKAFTWEAGRNLAHGLLGYIDECLDSEGQNFADISGLIIFRGPGSFTGLRIGITVFNTIAATNMVHIVGETGADWLIRGKARIEQGDNDIIVIPEYGGEAHITTPKK